MFKNLIKTIAPNLSPFAKLDERKLVDQSEDPFASEGLHSRRSVGRSYSDRKVVGASLFIILLFAAFLRLFNLGSIPPHLTPDEASLGYNAFSILKTGRDEYGNFLPIIFKSFGDYKPGLYVYATIPFIAAFGLSEWSVRLTSAISGIISVYLIFLIVRLLNKNKIEIGKWKISPPVFRVENVAALIAATNPWLIYFSRGAWEVNLALTLTLAGVYFFLRSLNKFKYLIFSSLSLSLTLLTYQGAKLSTLLVIAVLTITFWKECKKLIRENRKQISLSIIVGVLVAIPVLFSFFRGQTGRLQVFSLFSYTRPTELVEEILSHGEEKLNSINYYFFHSEYLYQFRTFLNHYFNHFSGRFLFFEGDWQNFRHTAPNSGTMLLFDMILLLLGVVFLLKARNKKITLFVFLWLILEPLPAVLSRDQVHAVRALNMAVPLTILSSFGLNILFKSIVKVKLKFYRIMFFSSSILLFFGSFIYFFDSYFVHVRIHQANDWYYGYREAVREVEKFGTDRDVLFIQTYAQPYIYFLFYRAADNPETFNPRIYQDILSKSFISGDSDVGLISRLDNITFAGFSWPAPAVSGDIVVGTPVDIPDFYANDRFILLKEIKQPNGNLAFRIVEKL